MLEYYKNKIIYLACPYTHKEKSIRSARSTVATIISACLIKNKIYNISPLTLQIPLEDNFNFPHTWDYWKRFDELLISRSDEVWVITIEGWEESVGVQEEIEMAKEFSKKIVYVNPTNDCENLLICTDPYDTNTKFAKLNLPQSKITLYEKTKKKRNIDIS